MTKKYKIGDVLTVTTEVDEFNVGDELTVVGYDDVYYDYEVTSNRTGHGYICEGNVIKKVIDHTFSPGDTIRRKDGLPFSNGSQFATVEGVNKHDSRVEIKETKTRVDANVIEKMNLSSATLETTPDNVNSPSHYTQGGIEPIDYMRSIMSEERFAGYLQGNVIKYISRYVHKNGVEDLRKSENYQRRLAEFESQRDVL